VPHGQDIHPVKSDLVDDAVSSFEDFPDRFILVFRYDPAPERKLADTVPALDQLIDEAGGVLGLIPGYMLKYLSKAEC
jgi:hypothetical protein